MANDPQRILDPRITSGNSDYWADRTQPLEFFEVGHNSDTGEQRLGPGMWAARAPGMLGALGANVVVRLATTGNVNLATGLNAGDTIDGVVLVAGDLVLVKSQTFTHHNGIYTVGASPARATGYTTYDSTAGILVLVTAGSTNAGLHFLNLDDTGGTIDSTAIVFEGVVPTTIRLEARTQFSNAPAATPVADDLLLGEDASAGGKKVKFLLSDLKTYFNA